MKLARPPTYAALLDALQFMLGTLEFTKGFGFVIGSLNVSFAPGQ